jgi:hypothetical protein
VGLTLAKTGMDHLTLVDHEFARVLLAYREAKSGLSTYGERFFEPTEEGREVYLEDRLYSSWGMCNADTGRMSCSIPNVLGLLYAPDAAIAVMKEQQSGTSSIYPASPDARVVRCAARTPGPSLPSTSSPRL